MESFSSRLTAAVLARATGAIVGLDPRWESLPAEFRTSGEDPVVRAVMYRRFCLEVIDLVAPWVPAVKPQAAFFEELGPHGMQVLADVCCYAQAAGLLVILDAKRGDIGSTAEAYARAYLAPPKDGGWGVDALTVNPYLGDDTLQPFVEMAVRHGRGVFVLVKTSNPGSRRFQDIKADGRPVYRHVAECVADLTERNRTGEAYGVVGAVVGATYPAQLAELRAVMPRSWLLVPGYGAQGGAAADVAPAFDERGLGALVNSSRGILFAHASPEHAGCGCWQDAVTAAVQQMIAELPAARSGATH